jgi:hypothetical protein
MASAPDDWHRNKRLAGLWRFAIAISLLNILGHTLLGFEQAWAHPFVALAAAYGMELSLEAIDAWENRRRPRFLGSPRTFIEFLLSAHITGLAVSMLLYANEQFWVIAFAAATSIASKTLFRAPLAIPGRIPLSWPRRHFLNPSNFGITITLLLFPGVGMAPGISPGITLPHPLTMQALGPANVIVPILIVVSGSLVNTRFTGRMPLISAWLATFAFQALLRSWWNGLPLVAALVPMSGIFFVLFTFFMVTDPATTPSKPASQLVFGASVAVAYGLLTAFHMTFGLFFALTIVTAGRGAVMHWIAYRAASRMAMAPVLVDPR